MFADYKKTAGVLLKIKVKKAKVNGEVQRKVISTDVVGRVSSIHRFECELFREPFYISHSLLLPMTITCASVFDHHLHVDIIILALSDKAKLD